jgi:hypothetical protein
MEFSTAKPVQGTCASVSSTGIVEKCTCGAEQDIETMEFSTAKPV